MHYQSTNQPKFNSTNFFMSFDKDTQSQYTYIQYTNIKAMPLYQREIQIKNQQVQLIVAKYWNLQLGKLIKVSQNHTFEAYSKNNKKYSVRVTPDPQQKHLQRIEDQLFFVQYLAKAGLSQVCSPVKPINDQDQKSFIMHGSIIIVVFEWAFGKPIIPTQSSWTHNKLMIKCWGRFCGLLHKTSMNFKKDHPQIVKRMQKWDDIHCSIMKGTRLHQKDLNLIGDDNYFGVIHGDLNITNINYDEQNNRIYVFDTEQVQVGYYLFDVVLACSDVIMLQDAGISEGINSKQYIEWIIEGYQQQHNKIDRDHLDRMIKIKKYFYVSFADKSKEEGDPPGLTNFLHFFRTFIEPKWKKELL